MWQQGSFQSWPMGGYPPNQQNPGQVDWAALAQAWRQSKDNQSNSVQQMPGVGPNMHMNNQQWQQQPGWSNQQWAGNNWNNAQAAPGFNAPRAPQWMPPIQQQPPQQQQQPPQQPQQQAASVVSNASSLTPPGDDLKPPPLPPFPPGEQLDLDAPPGTMPGPDADISSDTRMPSPPPHMPITIEAGDNRDNGEQSAAGGFDTPPQNTSNQGQRPPLLNFPTTPRPSGPWNEGWNSPGHQAAQWGPRGPPPAQWSGENMGQWYGGGQTNQFQQDQGLGMMNNNLGAGTDASKRKVLPAWIRAGLEKMEQEKQKQSEKEQAMLETEKPRRKSSGSESVIKSKFDSGSEEESDAELPQEENSPREASDETKEEEEVSEEKKSQDMLLKVRRHLTEILLDVTNDEIKSIALEVFNKESKAPAKQLARSSALSSISQLGIVAGYDSDEGSDVEVENFATEANSDLDEEELERKVEAFNKKQLTRIKLLEEPESSLDDVKINDKSNDVEAENDYDQPVREDTSDSVGSHNLVFAATEVVENVQTLAQESDSLSKVETPVANNHVESPVPKQSLTKSTSLQSESVVEKRHSLDRVETIPSKSKKSRRSRSRSEERKKKKSYSRKSRSRSREKRSRSRSREKRRSERSRSRERKRKNRSRSREQKRKNRSRSRERRRSYRSRSRSRERRRERSRSRDRKHGKKTRSRSRDRKLQHSEAKKVKKELSRKRDRHASPGHNKSPERKKSRKSHLDEERIPKSSKKDTKSKKSHKKSYDSDSSSGVLERSKASQKPRHDDSDSSSDSSDSVAHRKKKKVSQKKKMVKKRRSSTSEDSSSSSSSSSSDNSSSEESSPRYVEARSHKADKYVRKKSKSHGKRKGKQ